MDGGSGPREKIFQSNSNESARALYIRTIAPNLAVGAEV